MSNNKKNGSKNSGRAIDVLDRDQLIKIAIKLKLKESSGDYQKPYRNKNYIKNQVLEALKENAIKKNKNKPPVSYIKPVKKLIAIGDIHGDLSAAIKALKLADVIPLDTNNNITNINNIKWTGKDTVIVQLGDQIDRCRPSNWDMNDICCEDDDELYQDEGSDLKIICLFDNLHKQALKNGGGLYSILGNHELMNVAGDFRYVSPREFREFGNYFKASKTNKKGSLPFGYKERKETFSPGGIIARKLALTRYSVLQVGSWIFVHGGVVKDTSDKYTLDDINKHIKNWLLGSKDKETSDAVNDLFHNDDDSISPFWSRVFSDIDDWEGSESEELFNETLESLNRKNNRCEKTKAKGMVMGHSPQYMFNKGINHACNKKIWRVDVGMSRAFGPLDQDEEETKNRKVQVLLIEDDNKFKILKEQ